MLHQQYGLCQIILENYIHLQKIQQSELAPNDRDFVRAEMLRNFMKRATLKVEQE